MKFIDILKEQLVGKSLLHSDGSKSKIVDIFVSYDSYEIKDQYFQNSRIWVSSLYLKLEDGFEWDLSFTEDTEIV